MPPFGHGQAKSKKMFIGSILSTNHIILLNAKNLKIESLNLKISLAFSNKKMI